MERRDKITKGTKENKWPDDRPKFNHSDIILNVNRLNTSNTFSDWTQITNSIICYS